MKSIEIKDDGFTYRYDFPMERTLGDVDFVPDTILYNEPYVRPMEALRICMYLLAAIYGEEEMKKAYKDFDNEGCLWLKNKEEEEEDDD